MRSIGGGVGPVQYHRHLNCQVSLGRVDRWLVCLGRPITLTLAFTTSAPVELQTDVRVLVNGRKAHRGTGLVMSSDEAAKGAM